MGIPIYWTFVECFFVTLWGSFSLSPSVFRSHTASVLLCQSSLSCMLFWNHSYCFLQAANRNVYLRHFSTGFTFQTWTCPLWCSHTARSPFIQLLTAVPLRTHNLWFSARIGEENEIICCWFSLLFWTIQGSRMSHFFQTFQPQKSFCSHSGRTAVCFITLLHVVNGLKSFLAQKH